MKKKIFLSVALILVVTFSTANAYASGMLNSIINQGSHFGTSSGSMTIGSELSGFLLGDVKDIILLIGNLVFAAVTVILGAKYIWSSAQGKSEVMESLPTFVVAVLFFYLGGSVVEWLAGDTNNVNSSGAFWKIYNAEEWSTISGYIIYIVNTVVRYLSFAGILILGLRYMFASAEGKSKIKANFGGLVIGIVFVFLASNAVNFIIDLGESII